jgi:ABC-type Fe3+/spermidine/putrescine transport system ATPase subunit
MNHGTIQQVATTTEIYERPANDFVADFVGESNIFHGTVSAAGMVTLDNGRTLKVASSLSAGRKVGVLMRPERFSASGANAFAGEVIEAVYLGTSFKLRLACEGGLELLVRQPAKGSLPETGARIEVGIEPDAIHVF